MIGKRSGVNCRKWSGTFHAVCSRSFPDHFPIISRSFPAVWVVWQGSRSFPAVCSRSFPAVWVIWRGCSGQFPAVWITMFPIISRSLLPIISRSFGHLTNVPDHFPIISRSFPDHFPQFGSFGNVPEHFPQFAPDHFPQFGAFGNVPDHFPLFAPDHFLHMFRFFFRQIIQCLTSQGSTEYFFTI